jgi:hypothetical protein
VKADDLGDQGRRRYLHNRIFNESTLRICMEAAGFINIAPVDNHEAMVAPSSALRWQLALEGYKPSAAKRIPVVTHSAKNIHAVAAPICRGAALEHGDRAPWLHRDRLFVRWLLRRQTLDSPRFAFARIAKAIMQSVGAALPNSIRSGFSR